MKNIKDNKQKGISGKLAKILIAVMWLGWALTGACSDGDGALDEKDMRKYIEMMFSGQHLKAMEKYYAEDVVMESALLGKVVGRDKISAMLDGYFKFVEERHIPATIIVGHNEAAIELLSTMMVKADFDEHKAGDTWNARFNMHYSIEGGRIKRVSIYTYCKPCSPDQMKIPGLDQ